MSTPPTRPAATPGPAVPAGPRRHQGYPPPATGPRRAPSPGPLPPAESRCAPVAESRGEPLAGTARSASRWLLIEHPGPWGIEPPRDSRLDGAAAAELSAWAAYAGVKLMLIRRPGRDPAGTRRWAYVDSRPGREASWWGHWSTPADLLDLPAHVPPAGPPTAVATYLVCVNGRRDPCCGVRGRPVAAVLVRARPEQTWECSHIGGDRFAANLLALPHGLSYGRLTPATAVAVADAYERGHVEPTWLRGRTCLPPPAQAAEHFARQALGETSLDALQPRSAVARDASTWQIRLGPPEHTVLIRLGHTEPFPQGCRWPDPEPAPTFELLDIQPG
ncbi:MAG TPA: sucrase ferredoxin [Mycobacteriales bacterium]|nr:sucrase ferredoxin [Mycobacteriales bacterium]